MMDSRDKLANEGHIFNPNLFSVQKIYRTAIKVNICVAFI